MVSVSAPGQVRVSSIKLGDTVVTKTGHWSTGDGTLTLKSSYLSGLSNGEQAFSVILSDGDVIQLKVTVGA